MKELLFLKKLYNNFSLINYGTKHILITIYKELIAFEELEFVLSSFLYYIIFLSQAKLVKKCCLHVFFMIK